MDYNRIFIISDVDGTLTDPDHRIHPENSAAIRRFIDQGGRFTLATGREWHAMDEFRQDLTLLLPLILVNGAQIFNPLDLCVLSRILLPTGFDRWFLAVAAEFPRLGLIAITHTGAEVFRHPAEYETLPRFYRPYPLLSLGQMPSMAYKMLLVGADEDLTPARSWLEQRYGSRLSQTSSFPTLLDIMSAGVSKGAAVPALLEFLPVDCRQRKLVVVGDQENDLTLFKAADLSLAMGQAEERVRQSADVVLPDNRQAMLPYLLDYLDRL